MKKSYNEVSILGVSFKRYGRMEAYSEIDALLAEKRGVKIFTPNSEILYKAYKSPRLKELLNSADLLLPDGIGVIYASRLLRKPLPDRITGIDTAEHILRLAARNGLSVYLLGGRHRVPDEAAKRLTAKIPALHICGTHHGYFDRGGAENEEIINGIRAAAPDILFVCLGFPAQEQWITDNLSSLPSVRLAMGLGGSLDVWSGNKKRAPVLLQRLGFEWLSRSASDVSHLCRLPTLALFILSVLRKAR